MSIDNILLQNNLSKLLSYINENLRNNVIAELGQTQRTLIANKTDNIKVLEWLAADCESDVRNAVLNNPLCNQHIKDKVIYVLISLDLSKQKFFTYRNNIVAIAV